MVTEHSSSICLKKKEEEEQEEKEEKKKKGEITYGVCLNEKKREKRSCIQFIDR